VNAEIGIDEEGRPYLQLRPSSETENSMVQYLRPFMPWTEYHDGMGSVRIRGDRLPGSGPGVTARDASR
jgi:hypothetical protein